MESVVSDFKEEIDYNRLIRDFGVSPSGKVMDFMKDTDILYRRKMVFAHRGIDKLKGKFSVVSGFNPSSNLHIGHMLFLKQALAFQKKGADVFIPISNDESYVFKKTDSIERSTENAIKNIIPSIIAFGFKPKKTKIIISTKDPKIYELAIKLSTKMTLSSIKSVFGFGNESNPGQIFYTIVQSAHILYPQLEGPKDIVVPIGIDQDPYIRIVRDMAAKIGMKKPCSTYHKFIPGLQGGKMSGSKPETSLYLDDSENIIKKKIMKSFSGGRDTLEEHRKKGGNTEIDVSFQYLKYLFEENDSKLKKIETEFTNGSMTSGEIKKYLFNKVMKFLDKHKKDKKKAKSKVNKFLTMA